MIKSERLYRKKIKAGILPEPGDWGIQKGHQYKPWIHRREDVLVMHFITQATPDIQRKLKNLESGPQTSLSTLTEEAFKVKKDLGV